MHINHSGSYSAMVWDGDKVAFDLYNIIINFLGFSATNHKLHDNYWSGHG